MGACIGCRGGSYAFPAPPIPKLIWDRIRQLFLATGYDSGWVDIPGGLTAFSHNLGTKNLLSNIWVKRYNGKIIAVGGLLQADGRWVYVADLPDENSLLLANQDPTNYVEARVQMWNLGGNL